MNYFLYFCGISLQEELDSLKSRLEKLERERNEFKQSNEILETRVSLVF